MDDEPLPFNDHNKFKRCVVITTPCGHLFSREDYNKISNKKV
jgi:hypothetical protein